MVNKFETGAKEWLEGKAKTITFIVTEDCQLRCKYCYVVGKNSYNKMSFELAQKAIEYILNNKDIFSESAVIWDFIGGEPFLEIDLIDQICDFIKLRTYELNHPWFENYRFNITSNGLLYDDPRVQRYLIKNYYHVNVSITLDGTKTKHDMQRIYSNGKGSYDNVLKNINRWVLQFPEVSTKSTISNEDLAFIKESVLHLWSLGIKNVHINVVFENVWHDGDDLIFESQLKELADEIIGRKLYHDFYCSLFQRNIGGPVDRKEMDKNWCGAGKMLAIDHEGNFFPCIRFADYSLTNKKSVKIGNCFDGINLNRLRPFLSLTLTTQSSEECINCEVAGGCAWCQGGNYDLAETETIFQRATYICKMHKARVRANSYFWAMLDKKC
ncbi:MAG: radical SAM peptide maturase, CXXX-repeat target family [Mangrovibacterium sp.]